MPMEVEDGAARRLVIVRVWTFESTSLNVIMDIVTV
jgi:hypothetical protein